MKPDFVVVGASRSGTSTLDKCLRDVPGIFLPVKKELQFFEKDKEYKKGINHYYQYFNKASESQVKGEISPPYFHKGIVVAEDGGHYYTPKDSAVRMKEHLPNVKIIVTLRNPVDRLYSQYYKNYCTGHEKRSLKVALKEELDGKRGPEATPLCWIYKNNYSIHLSHWINLFGKDNVKVILFENWIHNISELKPVLEFLNIPSETFTLTEVPKVNSAEDIARKTKGGWFSFLRKRKDYDEMTPSIRGQLWDVLEEDIRKTEAMLDMDLSLWKKN